MAEVTGPVSSLPGSSHAVPDGAMCDDHQDRPAVRRIQGETDSFGSEQHDLCQECLDEIVKHDKEARIGRCDWCGTEQNDLRPRRDFEEGMSGPVYDVCSKCCIKENNRVNDELEALGYFDHDD